MDKDKSWFDLTTEEKKDLLTNHWAGFMEEMFDLGPNASPLELGSMFDNRQNPDDMLKFEVINERKRKTDPCTPDPRPWRFMLPKRTKSPKSGGSRSNHTSVERY